MASALKPWAPPVVDIITFTVDGQPVAKGRGRISTRGGFARIYTPAKTRTFEDRIRIAASEAMGGRELPTKGVTLTITAYIAIPKGMSKKMRQDALEGVLVPATRPDVDNYAKAALDGCNGVLFRDDSQVSDLIVRKRYAANPRLVITMEVEIA